MDKSVYDFRIEFYTEEGNFIDSEYITVNVDYTKNPEEDRDYAGWLVDEMAEEMLSHYGAWDYSVILTDAG